ncbi:MAG: hypothetical protein JSV00_03655 [bacterium]|nr:MAG: hypothetical protein JSV00_03655 [bacterium]
MTRRILSLSTLFALLILAGCAGAPKELPMDPSAAEAPVVFEVPEIMCVVQGKGISFAPDLHVDVFHFEGRWFWNIRGQWYWSRTYLGMLYGLEEKHVPGAVRSFSRDYRITLPECRETTFEEWSREFTPR